MLSEEATGLPGDTRETWRCCGDSLIEVFGGCERLDARRREAGVVALTQEPVADLNMALAGQAPGAAALLAELAEDRALPMLVLLSPSAARELAGREADFGFAEAGSVPLMILDSDQVAHAPAAPGLSFRAAATPADMARTRELVSQAFDLAPGPLARAFPDAMLRRADTTIHLVEQDGEIRSSVMVTRHGRRAGIWCMATPPDLQRRGLGRGLLAEAIRSERSHGISTFLLFATAAGRPLYDHLGFREVEQARVWSRGESQQV